KQGLPEDLALGLSVFLNSSVVDECFRRFSGHTQVNATDLRLLKYPSREVLMKLGRWARKQGMLTQEQIDQGLGSIL
ncbi:MAG: SAM-dependent methyltransferase, partial [Sulfurimicrobium sp.]|nr:SAM-dependent methyltransferase [Sulfurimicrobium sp.]